MSEQIIVARTAEFGVPTTSPFGPDDQMGMLNVITPEMRRDVMARADLGDPIDLSVDYFIGMPAWTANGDTPYQISLSHTPQGEFNAGVLTSEDKAEFTGDWVSMYTHTGTHIDSLNHHSYGCTIWNNFTTEHDLGSRHWFKCGADAIPPIVTRGILLDFPAALGIESLEGGYGIGARDVQRALDLAGLELRFGDAVLFRTGRMQYWPDVDGVTGDYRFPGLNLEGARMIAEAGAVFVGTDAMTPEQMPSAVPGYLCPVHVYLLASCGVLIGENLWLQELSERQIYEFAFVAAPLKLRGATGTPVRPVVFPIRPASAG